jgi:ornithine cyclodeaminase/alanine dehydrogenase-like protein (mu-crystallin family)
MEIRVLRGAEVRQLLPMGECIDLMQRTMIAVSEGRVVLPLRSILVMPGDRGMMGMMPGYLADPECFGVKLVSLIPRNKPPQYSSHLGLVLLFEAEHGQPVAPLPRAGLPRDCWRRRKPGTWRCWAPASRPAVISRRC